VRAALRKQVLCFDADRPAVSGTSEEIPPRLLEIAVDIHSAIRTFFALISLAS
jgi:hypothetical protein